MPGRNRGIVLQAIKYSDTSLIAKIFTEEVGMQSFMVKGAYGRKSKFRPALFQPMTLVELVSNSKPNQDLHFLSEIGVEMPYMSIPFHVQKNAVVLFVSELLVKTIHEQETNRPLFGFLHQSMEWLDLRQGKLADFPLYFMLELSKFLGFYPKPGNKPDWPAFDLLNGSFTSDVPLHTYYVTQPVSQLLAQLCLCPLDETDKLSLSNEQRRNLLSIIIDYYRLHVPGFKGLKSHEVLRVVME
jgi:DNA repair protein RecO (recombination protein O)